MYKDLHFEKPVVGFWGWVWVVVFWFVVYPLIVKYTHHWFLSLMVIFFVVPLVAMSLEKLYSVFK